MKQKPKRNKSVRKPGPPAQPVSMPLSPDNKKYWLYACVFIIFIISIISFSPVVRNGFISTWDDGVYVINNQLLHDLSFKGVINIFGYGDEFQRLVNNYHPLTTFSLALNYRASGLSPASYHIVNMIIHGINAILVFLFVYLLSHRRIWPALISGLLFAIHPMHVESNPGSQNGKMCFMPFFPCRTYLVFEIS